jgi:hypothetical protein
MWGEAGITFNRVASYLRARLTPEGGIFGDMAPVIRPTTDWLTRYALLALLNSSVLDFILRTFLGSRMHIEIGDVRRLPVPVLTTAQGDRLSDLTQRAVDAKRAIDEGRDGESLLAVEDELNVYVCELYGFAVGADFWVVR